MEPIIDVEYREVVELTDKTTEQLATEANTLWAQAEMVSNIVMTLMIRTGQRLQIIKDRLQHGEWEKWCADNLNFSKSKAEKMMSLAAKAEDENSIFSKTETFTDIGISKVWALLAAPEDVAEQVMENPQATDMSVREFKDEIQRLKKEKQGLEKELEAVTEDSAQVRTELEKEINRLQADLAAVPQTDPAALEEKEAELQKLQDKLAKEKEKSKKLKDSVDAEKEKAAAEARAAAEEEARKKFEQETKSLQESNQEAAAEIDRLTRKLANSANAEMSTFKAYADQLQKAFGSCIASIGKVETEDAPQAAKMRDALRRVLEQLVETI